MDLWKHNEVALNGKAPEYLSDLLQSHRPPRGLRSGDILLLATPKSPDHDRKRPVGRGA